MNASPFNASSTGTSPTASARTSPDPSPPPPPSAPVDGDLLDGDPLVRLTKFRQHVDVGEHIAFTILQDDDLELDDRNENGDEGIGSADESCKVRKTSDESPPFASSLEDQKTLTSANSAFLRAKLLDLTRSQCDLTSIPPAAHAAPAAAQKPPPAPPPVAASNQTTASLKSRHSRSDNNIHRVSYPKQHELHQHGEKHHSQSFNNIHQMNPAKSHVQWHGPGNGTGHGHVGKDVKRYHQQCQVPYQQMARGGEPRHKRSVENPTLSFTSRTAGNVKNRKKQQPGPPPEKRPVFVTTVKKGTFLEPPPEVAYLLGLAASGGNSNGGSSNSLCSSRERHQQQTMLYSFCSRPRVVHQQHQQQQQHQHQQQHQRKVEGRQKRDTKPTEEDAVIPYGNLMFDRRVVRGNTFAQPVPPRWNPYFGYAKLLSQTQEEAAAARQQEAKRRAQARRRAQGAQQRGSRLRVGTPPAVQGRRHEVIQTETRLEELVYNPSDKEVAVQTEFSDHEVSDLDELPVAPAEVTGCDVTTQVYPGDLFDFERAVLPLLAELAGATLEQALMEVMQEDELATLQTRQRRLLEAREVDAQEGTRVRDTASGAAGAAATRRRRGEGRTASVSAGGFLQDALPGVLTGLRAAGYMIDDVHAETEAGFLPWLMSEVTNEMTHMVNSKDILTDIVREILETRAEIYRVMSEEEEKHLRMSSDDDEEQKL